MTEYSVQVPYFASVMIKVTANSKEEALEKALKDVHGSVCHQCSRTVTIHDADTDSISIDNVEECDDE